MASMTVTASFSTAAVRPSLVRNNRRQGVSTLIQCNKIKLVDVNKQGLERVKNKVVQENLKGLSSKMNQKGWKDSQGREGKGFGVYRFSKKYGANVDGYSPIYQPDYWSESGETYKLGKKGLLAWAGLVTILLGVGINLVLTTSQLGQ